MSAEAMEAARRPYPDKGLRSPSGEYRSTLVELVAEVFGPPPTRHAATGRRGAGGLPRGVGEDADEA